MKSCGILFAVLSLSTLTATQVSAETLMFRQGDSGAYSSTQGAYVTLMTHTGNGASTVIRVTTILDFPSSLGFLRFPDIIGNAAGQIPPGSTIESAYLNLTRFNNSGQIANLGLVNEAWEEGTITGASYPGVSGGAGSVPAGAGGSHAIADITSAVQAWASGTPNWGVRIMAGFSQSTSDQSFYSDDATILSTRPLLTVTFSAPPTATSHSTWGEVKALYHDVR
jgi:hypothetical protein